MKRVCRFVLSLAMATVAFADHHQEPMVKQLDWLAGKFQCRGTAFATPMAPEHATMADVDASWDLGGSWIRFAYAEKKTDANPKPLLVSGYFGYDGMAKKFVVRGFDNWGGYAHGESDGMSGDSLTFSGPWTMTEMTVASRDTFKKAGRDLWHLGEVEMDGKWVKVSEETCTRK